MDSILKRIADRVRVVEMARWTSGEDRPTPCSRSAPIDVPSRMKEDFFCIAEVKKGSPSRGIIRESFNPADIARAYARGGADAVSVVTEEEFFYGSKEYLTEIRAAVDLPILRKDFLINTDQVIESFNLGADMVLLIVACLNDGELFELYHTALELGMTPIVEVHDETELGRALQLDSAVVGINNRNLADFSVDLNTSMKLKEKIPSGTLVISESGIGSHKTVKALKRAGFAGMLVGEALLKPPDCEAALKELIHG